MHRTIGVFLALAFLSACATTSEFVRPVAAGHQAGEEAAVLQAMDRYLTAISVNDVGAMAALQMADGMTFVERPKAGGGTEIVGRPNRYWVDPARARKSALRERYWSPTVLLRGSIAVVWAPYEFWIDGQTSHCGVDVFDFVKVEGQWRLSNAMWSVEPDACDELRPATPDAIRPAS